MENLPSEIQWNVIKYMRHPVADIVIANKEYQAYLRKLEYALDGWRPCPPSYLLKQYEELTFDKYYNSIQKKICNKNNCVDIDSDSDSD